MEGRPLWTPVSRVNVILQGTSALSGIGQGRALPLQVGWRLQLTTHQHPIPQSISDLRSAKLLD